jgi:hypothetical protein
MPNARCLSGVVFGIFAVTASTASAQNATTSAGQPLRPALTFQASIERAIERSLPNQPSMPFATLPPRTSARAQDQTGSGPTDEPTTFFASRKGIAVLAILGAGVGYAAYSKVHDRIHSKNPER